MHWLPLEDPAATYPKPLWLATPAPGYEFQLSRWAASDDSWHLLFGGPDRNPRLSAVPGYAKSSWFSSLDEAKAAADEWWFEAQRVG